jgi:geranylgeranyl diphosphate synthase, type I
MRSTIEPMLEKIEQQLFETIQSLDKNNYPGLIDIFEYQMGWTEKNKKGKGKRIRPLVVLLTTDALGQEWKTALPAAAALELLHNYSLIHDDIEDSSKLRRGKETVWVKWGQAQAINTGDAMLNLALQTPWQLKNDFSLETVSEVFKTLQHRSLELTQGQYLDISFETQNDVSVIDYFKMIEGKTCSLIKAAFEMGAIFANANVENREILTKCGSSLGRAYQIQDDWLGIWGDEAVTGKSNQSDLCERKKSYPILLGLEKNGAFASAWKKSAGTNSQDVAEMASLLESEGVKQKCEFEFDRAFNETIELLNHLDCQQEKLGNLTDFVRSLLKRKF